MSVAGPPAIFAETNSLWIENSPIPEKTPGKVVFTRDMAVTNYAGTKFRVRAGREVGLIPAARMAEAGKPVMAV